jgi:hypothetical protein
MLRRKQNPQECSMPILLYAAVWGAFFGMFSLEQNADDA